MKAYIYDRMKGKIATIIRKNTEFEYTSTSEGFMGTMSTYNHRHRVSREQAETAAEKILMLLDITRDETSGEKAEKAAEKILTSLEEKRSRAE